MKYIFTIAMILLIISHIARFIEEKQKQKERILRKREKCYVCGVFDLAFLPEREWHWRRVKCRRCGNEWPALSI